MDGVVFFFSSRRRHTRWPRDWSSDVCSSDLDVDAELERGGRHQRLELAVLEPLLGVEALLLGEAAVMRRDLILADALGELARHALGHPSGVDEDERGAMRLDQPRETVVDLLPDFSRHHGLERRVRNLD